ncbi:MAG: hypothetical protein ACI8W8_004137 [Rhodothermales bacterium]|jgi:uncharacterized protein (TIGR02722 family)
MKKKHTLPMLVCLLLSGTGCALFQANTVEFDPDTKRHYDNKFDYTDLRSTTDAIYEEMIADAFLVKQEQPPVLMIAGVQNRTEQYLDTKGMTDRIRAKLLRAKKARFVNAYRRADLEKEQGYQAQNATPETRSAIGQQLGAQYLLSGSLYEMTQEAPKQVRLSKKKTSYYKLVLEVTDLVSSEVVWVSSEHEIVRESSTPLVGW